MTAAVTSLATLTYGSLTIGGSSDYQPHGKHSFTVDEESGTLTVDFPFTVTSGLSSAIDSLEEKLREREADLEITFNGKARSWKKSAGTGFAHTGRLIKPGHRIDSRTTRHHIAQFTVVLPAIYGPDADGRRNAREQLDVSPAGRPTLTLTGEYTGIPGTTSAKANYLAKIGTYYAAVLASYAGTGYDYTFEATPQRQARIADEWDSVLSYSLTFEGIIHEQLEGETNSALLIDSDLTVEVVRRGSDGDTPAYDEAVQPPVTAIASHTTWINLAVESDLKDAWEDSVLPYLIGVLEEHLDVSTIALMLDAPRFNYREAQISGRLEAEGYSGLITAHTLSVSKGGSPAERIVPRATGDSLSADVLYGAMAPILTMEEHATLVGKLDVDLWDDTIPDILAGIGIGSMLGSDSSERKPIAKIEAADAGGQWVRVGIPELKVNPRRRGLEGHTVDLVDVVVSGRWQRIVPYIPVTGTS